MKKGDLRKQEILNTAEQLFCRKGYEQTSIQDILDQLHSSKGSFYHHFISKESLLEGICRKRADQIFETVSGYMNSEEPVIQLLDTCLSGMIPLKDEKLSFLLMILPVFPLPEGRLIRDEYCDSLADRFASVVIQLLQRGHSEGVLICSQPDVISDLILFTVNRLWVKICSVIISAEQNHNETDLSELLRITDSYRQSIEKMLFLPYGSLKLIDIPTLGQLTEQIHTHWKS